VYSVENDSNYVNNDPAYSTLNDFYKCASCPYTTGPGQAVIKPIYIYPNGNGQGYSVLQDNFLPASNNGNYYTLSTGYPYPAQAFAPVALVQTDSHKK
jgi:hypothetical protein